MSTVADSSCACACPPAATCWKPVCATWRGKQLKRGNVTANLTVKREDAPKLAPDPAALEQVLVLALELAMRIPGAPPPRAEALLALPGVLRPASTTEDEPGAAAQLEAVRAGFAEALDALVVARQGEGARLAATLTGLLDEIAVLRDQATAEAADQPAAHRARMLESLRDCCAKRHRCLRSESRRKSLCSPPARTCARNWIGWPAISRPPALLLTEAAPIGRRFDFLVQEFNREANTLCSKSASMPLTATGLKLKAAIEQLREQVQNIE